MPGAAAGAKRKAGPRCTNVGFWKGRSTRRLLNESPCFPQTRFPLQLRSHDTGGWAAAHPACCRRGCGFQWRHPPGAPSAAAAAVVVLKPQEKNNNNNNNNTKTLLTQKSVTCEFGSKELIKPIMGQWFLWKASNAPGMSMPIHKLRKYWEETLNASELSGSNVSNCEEQCSTSTDI